MAAAMSPGTAPPHPSLPSDGGSVDSRLGLPLMGVSGSFGIWGLTALAFAVLALVHLPQGEDEGYSTAIGILAAPLFIITLPVAFICTVLSWRERVVRLLWLLAVGTVGAVAIGEALFGTGGEVWEPTVALIYALSTVALSGVGLRRGWRAYTSG